MHKTNKIKTRLRLYSPELVLNLYRSCRNFYRMVFKSKIDIDNSLKFKELILQRFPEIEKEHVNGTVLDLGANVGNFTSACVLLGFDVIAVEPHPVAFQYLKDRSDRNKWGNVSCMKIAVSNEAGITKLFTHPQHKNDPIATSISSSIVADKFLHKSDYFEVETVTLDKFFENEQKYDILKIDIEGAEMHLVDQIISNSSRIKYLLVETHERFMDNSLDKAKYSLELSKLNRFISDNGLHQKWLTDWI